MCATTFRSGMSRRRWMRWPKRSPRRCLRRRLPETGTMVIENCNEVVYVTGLLGTNQWPAIKTTATLVALSYPEGVVIDFSGVHWASQSGESTLEAALDD